MTEGTRRDPGQSITDRVLEFTLVPFLLLFGTRPAGWWGFFALVILLFVGGYQLTPGHEWVKTDWPREAYFGMAAVVGAVVGFLGSERRWAGMAAGAVASTGALVAIGLVHAWLPDVPVKRVWSWASVVALAVGMIPGVVLYAASTWLVSVRGTDVGKVNARLQRRRRERGLSAGGDQRQAEPGAAADCGGV